MTNYAAVLLRRHAGREWTLDDNDYESLTMRDGGPKPTQKELDAAWPSVESEMQNEAQNKKDARTSALAKLKALGLTDQEIAALVGA